MLRKSTISILAVFGLFFFGGQLMAQIAPMDSPYNSFGPFSVLSEAHTDSNPDVYSFRPDASAGEKFPVFMFQLGANGIGSNAIDHTSYDIFMEHLASWGYIVLVIDDASAGLPNGASFTSVYSWYEGKLNDQNHWMNEFADNDKVVVGGHSNGGVNATGFLQNNKESIAGVVFFASYPSEGVFGIGAHNIQDFGGYVLSIAGDEDGQSTPADCLNGYNLFQETECKYYVNIDGLGHGGFGDYVNANQPVGSIGRDDATASIRHYLVSFMEFSMKEIASAESHLKLEEFQPSSTKDYESTCPFVGTDEEEEEEEEEEDTTSTSEFEIKHTIYPNPTSGLLTIESDQSIQTIEVVNSLGKIVFTASQTNQIDVSHLERGVYILKLNNQFQKRFIKQ